MKRRAQLAAVIVILLVQQSAAQSQQVLSGQDSATFKLRTSDGHALPVSDSVAAQFDLIFTEVGARLGISREDFAAASWSLSPMAQQLPELAPLFVGGRGPNITVTFQVPAPGNCKVRGAAAPSPGAPAIQIFADEDTPLAQILGVLAHESGHLFQWLVVAKGSVGFLLFNEGFASWAAKDRWVAMIDMPSLQGAVATYLEDGRYIPLLETSELRETIYPIAGRRAANDCVARRDVMYTEWGAFIEYLVTEFGRETMYEFIRASTAARADPSLPTEQYTTYFGRTLEQLEGAWLSTLSLNNRAPSAKEF
jgi:hypothetical protein